MTPGNLVQQKIRKLRCLTAVDLRRRASRQIHYLIRKGIFQFASHVHAETATTFADLQTSKRLAPYIGSRSMHGVLLLLGMEQDRKFGLQVNCKSQFEVKPLAIVIFSPIDLPDGNQHPTKGTWLFRYALSRCGEAKIYNALFAANGKGGTPMSRAYYPGSTIAHPVLVKDAMVSAMANAMIRSEVKGCKNADIFDMRVTEQPHNIREGKKELKGGWSETWTFRACDRTVDVPVTFAPDIGGGGTTFTIKMR